jgi:cytochrome P450
MEDFCRDLPLSVICEMLGLPDTEHERFKNWLGGFKDTANIGAVIHAIPGVLRVVRYLRKVSRHGGGAKPDGLIIGLQDAEIEGRRLSEDEIVSMIFLLFGAGQETTTHLISGGLLEILRHDDQRRQLQADPGLMPLCVEECLRHVSPVQLTKPRWATRNVSFAGDEFRRGEMVDRSARLYRTKDADWVCVSCRIDAGCRIRRGHDWRLSGSRRSTISPPQATANTTPPVHFSPFLDSKVEETPTVSTC